MLETAEDIYRAFLDGIKKNSTSIVTPNQFNRIINDWGQDEWLKQNCLTIEFNQKQIEDLERIRVVTDGEFTLNGNVIYPIAPTTSNLFIIPKYTYDIVNRQPDGTEGLQTYPPYYRLLNVSFKLEYGSENECGLTGISDWLDAKIMRSDLRNVIMDNPFRKPTDARLYYEILNGQIRLITGTNSIGYSMRIEYLRRPNDIVFVPGEEGTPCEFNHEIQKEIIDIAVRVYLERVKDPRWQSFIQEELIRKQIK